MSPPLHSNNKVYTLKPQFITNLKNYFRKIKLKYYKNKKVKEEKTAHVRNYHLKFKIHLRDDNNPQVSDVEYEIVIPAKAIFLAKLYLTREIKEKIHVEVTDWEEMSEEEVASYHKSKKDFEIEELKRQIILMDSQKNYPKA